MYDFHIVSWSGGEYETFYSVDRVYISREKAESAFSQFVSDAKDVDDLFDADRVEVWEARLDEESGAVMSTKIVRSWYRYEED